MCKINISIYGEEQNGGTYIAVKSLLTTIARLECESRIAHLPFNKAPLFTNKVLFTFLESNIFY